MNSFKSRVFSILMLTVAALLLSAPLLAHTTSTTDSSKSAELQTRLKYLALQKKIDSANSQLEELRKQEKATPAPRTTDEAIALTNLQIKEDDLQTQITALKNQQQALLNPPPPVSVPVIPTPTPTPEPAPGPAKPAQPQETPTPAKPNCRAQQVPKVSVKPPKKASDFACKHLGVCVDAEPAPVNGGNACPSAPPAARQSAKQ